MEPWFAEAKPVPSLEAEIGFLLWETFPSAPQGAGGNVVQLELPDDVQGPPLRIGTAEADAQPVLAAQLAAYYRQVAGLARQRGLGFDAVRQYFWLDLRLHDEATGVQLHFPWYDTFATMDHFLAAVAGDDTGRIYDDLDQGWEIEAWAEGDTLYIRECDPDAEDGDDDSAVAVKVPRAALRERTEALRARTRRLLDFLARELGADVFTSGQAPASFL